MRSALRRIGVGLDRWPVIALVALLAGQFAVSVGLLTLADVLVFALVVGLLDAVARRERRAALRASRAAALAERRRVARDLHDGIAQDLALIAAFGAELAGGPDAEHPVAVAARRALTVTRGVIDELSTLEHTPPRQALDALASELTDRYQMAIEVRGSQDASLPAGSANEVLRIAREAITNAARHGNAARVTVSLECEGGSTLLRVRDDGIGIVDEDGLRRAEGFGITSMRDRAAGIGGRLTVNPLKSGGTELVVSLP